MDAALRDALHGITMLLREIKARLSDGTVWTIGGTGTTPWPPTSTATPTCGLEDYHLRHWCPVHNRWATECRMATAGTCPTYGQSLLVKAAGDPMPSLQTDTTGD